MKILLSIVGFALLGALIVVIAVHTAALVAGLVLVSGVRAGAIAGHRPRAATGKCAGIAAGASIIGLAPFGFLLAPACSALGVRLLFRLSWRQAVLVVLVSGVVVMSARLVLPAF